MKKLSFLFLVVSFALNAHAAYVPGTQCGLTEEAGDGWVTTKTIRLRDAQEEDIQSLPTLTKQQLIIAAKESALFEKVEIKNTLQAVEFLRSNSDGNELSLVHFTYKGGRFTQVLHFPGDNPYGYIFEQGTRHVVALNQDGSVSCK